MLHFGQTKLGKRRIDIGPRPPPLRPIKAKHDISHYVQMRKQALILRHIAELSRFRTHTDTLAGMKQRRTIGP